MLNLPIAMFSFTKRGRLRPMLAAQFLLWATIACAQQGVGVAPQAAATGLSARYAAGSIQSVETADHALADAVKERAAIEQQFVNDQNDCYPKFFTTSCLDDAKERRRAALAKVSAVEVEAKTFKRHARVDERDKALAEQRARDEADAPQRMKMQLEAEAKAAEKAAKLEAESGKAASGNTALDTAVPAQKAPELRAGKAEIKRTAQKAGRQLDAQKRAENIAAFDKKLQEADAHQREIAARKAEKEKDKARKALEKDAAAAPAASAADSSAK